MRTNGSRRRCTRCRCSRLRGCRRYCWCRNRRFVRRWTSGRGRFHGGWLRRWRGRSRRRARLHCGWRGRFHPRGLRRCFSRLFFYFGSGFYLRFLFGGALNFFAHLFRDVRGDRARVRLLFRDAIPRQQINDGFRLDLEFAGQLVDSDLIYVGHALRSGLRLRLFRLRLLAFTASGRGLFGRLRGGRRFLNCICRL